MRYWESSAIVPLLVDEASTLTLRKLLDTDSRIITWWGTLVECESALSRIERERSIDQDGIWTARDRLRNLSTVWTSVRPGDQIRRTAISLIRTHPLRAADALQLAAALHASHVYPAVRHFICNDVRLASAARREGLHVN